MTRRSPRQLPSDSVGSAGVRSRWASAVFMDAADPILVEDLDGNVIDMNLEAERSYGWSRSELLNRPIRTIVPSERHEQANDLLARCRRGEDVRNVEGLRQSKQGEVIPVLLTLSLLRDDDGQPTGVVSIAKDISNQKAAEDQLRSMSKVFMEAADPIIIEDLDGRVIEMNREAERVYGWPREELLGEPITRIVPTSRHDQARDLLVRCKAGDKVRNVEGVRETRSRLEIPILLTLSLLRDEQGEPVGIASLAKDITARKAAEQELREHQDQLEELVAKRTEELEIANEKLADATKSAEEANQAKSSFLANMSHELRTPMNAIIGYSEMLMEEADDLDLDSFTSDLKKIHGAGRHLLELINDILDLSKIEAGRMELFLERFEVDTLVDDVASTVDSLVKKNRNELVIERGDGLGTVKADLTKVRQMLFNLLSNASKFTKDGRITLAVERGIGEDEGWISYCVADSGIGIPADKIGGLFEEFSQVDASTTRDFGGTGLGLAITRRFCEMMGGAVTVESVPGEGSTFTIRLPVEVVDDETAAAETQDAPPEGTCVLVIDDEAASRELLRRTLERDGARVVVASSGDEGLRLARELRPVLITLDVLMPGKDGWAVLRELKADPDLHHTPVVMISMADGGDMGFALGATDYLSKPVERDQLKALLERHGVTSNGRVLVVDDDEATRSLARRLLEQEGCAVEEATNGKEALDRVERRKPDLIVLDLMMPVMDGFAFAAELRRSEQGRGIPVIVSTSKDLTPEERAALSGVVEEILEKNALETEELMAEIRAILSSSGTRASGA